MVNLLLYLLIFSFIYISNQILCNNSDNSMKICESSFNNNQPYLNEKDCLNNVIKFDSKKYIANNFAKNKEGDLIFELTESKDDNTKEIYTSRLFYGLTKEGLPFFTNNTAYIHEIKINESKVISNDNEYHNLYNSFNSINLFVSLKNDLNKNNQYLFSINSKNSIVELFNLNDNDIYYLWSFNKFFDLNIDQYMFTYNIELFELKEKNEYFISFIPKNNVTKEMLELYFIKKFRFKSFDESAYEEINSIKYSDYLNTRIINVVLLDGTLAVLTCIKNDNVNDDDNDNDNDDNGKEMVLRRSSYYDNMYKFNLKFYNYNLKYNNYIKDIVINNTLSQKYYGYNLFIKSLYIGNNYIIYVYILNTQIIFDLFDINFIEGKSHIEPIMTKSHSIDKINLDTLLCDLVKIENNKLAFIYTTNGEINNSEKLDNQYDLYILIINLNKNEFDIHSFNIGFGNYVPKLQILGTAYNNYLIFATSSLTQKEDENYLSNQNKNYFSLLMIFGYANGTDSIIDISIFLEKNKNYTQENFYEFLYKNYTIENNIFEYESETQIKLVFIPKEIFIHENNSKDELLLLNSSSFMKKGNQYILKENIDLIKTSQLYYIEYQYLIKESENKSKIYFGRINRLKFKLCHKYCDTCYELSMKDNNQKCSSCLDNYQYDYFSFINNPQEKNCVPEGYYYDYHNNSLVSCEKAAIKYYINKTSQKIICFNDTYDCPLSYPIYNESSNECYQCDYEHYKIGGCNPNDFINCYKNGECILENNETLDNSYEKIKNGFIPLYNGSGNIILNNGNNYVFQITTLNNEMNNLNNNIRSNLSIINLKDCENLLKSKYGLESDVDLVILKYENENLVSNGNEKSIQYEIYIPNTSKKLDLSICSNKKIDIYIPIEISEKTQKLYEHLRDRGYNLFDKNDIFYNDICTPYKSENGTDILLSDRYNDFFVPNQLICQKNCEYSAYLNDSKYLKCECNIDEREKMEIINPEKITVKSIVKTFYDVLKYSNYKVLKCYKLVFLKDTIINNIGSIISNIYFIGYLISFGLFFYNKKFFNLQTEIEQLTEKRKNSAKNNYNINKQDTISLDIMKYVENSNDLLENKKNKTNVIKINNKKTIEKKILIEYKDKNINPSEIIDLKNISSIKIIQSSPFQNVIDDNNQNNSSRRDITSNRLAILSPEPLNDMKPENNNETKKIKFENNKSETPTDYELNDLDYFNALELDNRNFLRIYWYLIKREHLIIFTFFNKNDYNIFSVKLSKLFLAICTDMAFNVFFFSDESMHNIYVSGGKYDYIGQLAQMIYSTIISQILQTFINFLTMTDILYYRIKETLKEKNVDRKQFLFLIKCIKYKINIFYIFSFLLFLFFWYLISAFCAVYKNTQKIFIIDSISSFIMGLIYPFVLYLAPTGLRIISLKAKTKKNLKFLYILSDKIPFF